jgi:hypothetical protein
LRTKVRSTVRTTTEPLNQVRFVQPLNHCGSVVQWLIGHSFAFSCQYFYIELKFIFQYSFYNISLHQFF